MSPAGTSGRTQMTVTDVLVACVRNAATGPGPVTKRYVSEQHIIQKFSKYKVTTYDKTRSIFVLFNAFRLL